MYECSPRCPRPSSRLDPSEVQDLLSLPFNDLLFQAQTVHRAHFDPNEVQVSTLFSIKTGPAWKIANIVPRALAITPGSRPSG